jgi:hypothetical protein
MYECHGWTDKFQLFQFSFSSVAYSQVSLSVRPEQSVGQQTKTQIDRVIHSMAKNLLLNLLLNVTDGTIQEQTCRT